MEFRILGPLEVWDDGRVLPLKGSKQRALLALLLLHSNQVVATDRLIDEPWDLDSREAGWAALRVRLHELRKLLPDGVLQTRPPGYVIRVDAARSATSPWSVVRPGAAGAVLVPFGGADDDWAAVELGAWAARA